MTDRQWREPERALVKAEEWLCVALVLGVLGLVVFQVVSRYVLERPSIWSEELARFALVWLTFIAAGYVMSRGAHVTVVVGSKLLGARGGALLRSVASLIVLVACAALLFGSPEFLTAADRTSSPAASIPMSWVYGSAVVGFLLMAVHSLVMAVTAARHPDELPAADEFLERM